MMNENEVAACLRRAMEQYFADLDGEQAGSIYQMVIGCVEKPVLEVVLKHAQGNQTHAADLLGINRNTLRKKMKEHGIK
jgi:Fis family transcriptional regulator